MKLTHFNKISAEMLVSKDELSILLCALNEVYKSIDAFEFSTRMGVEPEEVKRLMDEITLMIDTNAIQKPVEEKVSAEDSENSNFEIKIKAQSLEDNWLMCPICIDAWQTESNATMVKCPKCKTTMHNPNKAKHEIENFEAKIDDIE